MCSQVLLEKLTLPQLLKKFSAFYGTGRFVTKVHTSQLLVPVLSNVYLGHALLSYLYKD
jgi:hypothetical protein